MVVDRWFVRTKGRILVHCRTAQQLWLWFYYTQPASAEIKVSTDRVASATLLLRYTLTLFRDDEDHWPLFSRVLKKIFGGKLNREEGGNELSSSFKLNLCPAPAREQAIPSAVNLSSRRKLTFWSRPRSFVSLTGLLSTAHERTYQFHPRRRIDPHYSSSSLFREKNPLCST